MDRLLGMEIFVSVVELRSFTAAARAYRISAAMVSKHISVLERRLGSMLLTRTTRRLHLTEAGQNYYERCKQILRDIKLAESGAADMNASAKGLLKVTASVWFGSFTLAPIISDYLTAYPEMQVELSLTDRFVDLVDEGFDVAIRIGELSDSSFVAKRLATFQETICASPEYLQRFGVPQKPQDLINHQCMEFTNWPTQGGWSRLYKRSSRSQAAPPRFRSNSAQALRSAAIGGLGLILMPRDLIINDIKNGALVEVLQKHIPPSRPIHAVYPGELQSLAKLQTFVDYLISSFSN
ncbi:HTH-type transcriptional regulator DmlR [mine drainage metagenome]|uniref:HTH-type transcriptional regulator DmlR n=1 Tax=mine drainage metagenome TaxID=410659 RepID=A0A1J5QL95_9ZZZZ